MGMYQREALWLGFAGEDYKPNAVKVAVGGVNAVSGTVWEEGLNSQPQNYLVCPNQPWLDGINAGDGFIRQFVATPLGSQETIEAQITGAENVGGIHLTVYEPKAGVFADEPPETTSAEVGYVEAMGGEMGLAAGGKITQKIYRDPYSIDVWEQRDSENLDIYILNSEQYQAITGVEPPAVVSLETYAEYGLPWFELYDKSLVDVPPPENLAGVKTTQGSDDAMKNGVNAGELPTQKLHLRKSRTLNRPRRKGNKNE